MGRKYRSVEMNMLLNTAKTLIAIVLPLITFPYVAHVLGVAYLGKVNFVQSFVSYIALISSLGISTYAIREGGKYRNNEKKLRIFVNQVFSINLFSSLLSYIVLFFCLLISPKLQQYAVLLIIQSTIVIFTTLGVDWLNIIYEDYLYITIRSIVIQLISLLLIFSFVKSPIDYGLYLTIQVSTTGVIAVSNFFHLGKKFYRPRFVFKANIKEHIKPILILFSNNVAVSIYLNIDTVMIGWFSSEYYVGLYAVAVKIYGVCKQLISATYSVTVTRLTEYYTEGKTEEYKKLLNSVLNNIIVVIIPIIVGLYVSAKEIVNVLVGSQYEKAILALKILDISIFFAILGGAFAYCVNLPMKKEKNNLIATMVSAVENFSFNMVAIPMWKANGAALTTLLSELTVFIILVVGNRESLQIIKKNAVTNNFMKCCFACLPIVMISYILHQINGINDFMFLAIIIPISIVLYFVINVFLKNTFMVELLKGMIKRKRC